MSLVFSILKPWTLKFNRYEMSSYIVLYCAIYVQTACLCILLMIRFGVNVENAIDKPSAALAKPFDFFAMSNGDSNIDRLIDRLRSRSLRCVGFVFWIFARFTISLQFRSRDGSPVRNDDGLQAFVFLLRSSGIVVVVISLLAVMFTNLVLEPVLETGMTPQKLSTTSALPYPFLLEADNINWSIIPVSKIFALQMCLFRTIIACRWQIFVDMLNEESKLQDAVQVEAIWDNESGMSLASY